MYKSKIKIVFILLVLISAQIAYGISLHNFLKIKCIEYNVPEDIALSVAIVESNFTMIVSTENWNKSKDIGIFQINSRYVKWFEKTFWYKDKAFDPYNPYDNIEMGIIYLSHLYKETHYWSLAVRAFHQGLYGLKSNPGKSTIYFIKVSKVLNSLRNNNE